MDDQTLSQITKEIAATLAGGSVNRVFQLSRLTLAIQFRGVSGDHFLLAGAESADPRLYIIRRRVAELNRIAAPPSPFALALRKHLGGAILTNATKDITDRIVRLTFDAFDEAGKACTRILVIQLTGRSANLFLLDETEKIIEALRRSSASHQSSETNEHVSVAETRSENGDIYVAPPAPLAGAGRASRISPFERDTFATLSEAADVYYTARDLAESFDARIGALSARVGKEIEKQRRLQRNLERDLAAMGNAAEHRRIGELLLANVSTAEREGERVRVTDYYAEDAPIIEIEIDENRTLQEEAAARFARYGKAKRAAEEIGARLQNVTRELTALEARRNEIERVMGERNKTALETLEATNPEARQKRQTREAPSGKKVQHKSNEKVPRTRAYRSSDGYEIIVGRAARENDYLTFRLARPHDLWLHAADYPGAHVVVRNPSRGGEIPQRTIIEAAQLAAFTSQARDDSKVAVHYTPRKFISKPKGAAPGLVRLSSFRTLLVEPRESVERID